jgi:hypothetical protein
VIARFIDADGVTHQEVEVPDPPPTRFYEAHFKGSLRFEDDDTRLSVSKISWELHFILGEADGGPIAIYRPERDIL